MLITSYMLSMIEQRTTFNPYEVKQGWDQEVKLRIIVQKEVSGQFTRKHVNPSMW